MRAWITKGDKITRCIAYGTFGAAPGRPFAHEVHGHFLYEVFSVGSALITDLRTMECRELALFSADEQLAMVLRIEDTLVVLTRASNEGVSKVCLLSLRGHESSVFQVVADASPDATIGRRDKQPGFWLNGDRSGEFRVFDASGTIVPRDATNETRPLLLVFTTYDDEPDRPYGTYAGLTVRRRRSQLVLEDDRSLPSRSSDAVAVTSIAISDDASAIAFVEDELRARIIDGATLRTEREITFDAPTRVLRFCEGGRSVAFAQETPKSIEVLLWTRGLEHGELSEVYRRDGDAGDPVGSVVEINAAATRVLLRYPSERGSFACVTLADRSETDVSMVGAITTCAQFLTDDLVASFAGIQTSVLRALAPGAALISKLHDLTRWMVFNVTATREARAMLPAPLVDWWSKGSRWREIVSIAASPSTVVIAADPALVGVYSLGNAVALSTIERGAQRLAKITQVAIARDKPRFVVALDSGQILLCDVA